MATIGETEGICEDTIESWCIAHGYSVDQAAVLTEEGVETFNFIGDLEDSDKRELADALELSEDHAASFLKAMEADATMMFSDAICDGITVDEYRKRMASPMSKSCDPNICKDTTLSWCLANGYTAEQADKLVEAGADTFTFMTDLTDEEKKDLAIEELGLKKLKAKKIYSRLR